MVAQPFISVVSPVYGALGTLPELVERVQASVEKITSNFEVVLVDDRGPGNAWEVISALAQQYSFVRGIQLSRNFGQHYAITAGLAQAKGDWIVVMDCDLQDVPEEISKLYQEAVGKEVSIVLARRKARKDSLLKKLGSKSFYFTLSYLTGLKYDAGVANFGIYDRRVIDAVLAMGDKIRYFPAMIKWVGFDSQTLDVEHAVREEGKSSYSLKRLLRLALDIILSFSDKPIRIMIKVGVVVSMLSFIGALWMIYRYFAHKIEVSGYASLIVSIWFFSGLIMSLVGVVGLYVGKTFESTKHRPVYIVQAKTG